MAWKWYVYKFYLDDVCVYVGKGSGNRFKAQQRRFKTLRGEIVSCYKIEQDALDSENALIKELCPQFNKALMPVMPEPWKYSLLPDDKSFYAWCIALGTRQMAARILLAKGRSIEKYGVDYKAIEKIVFQTLNAQNVPVYA